MITKEELISAGYRAFTQRNYKEFTNSFWQKCFRDSKGRKYYITIAEYDNTKFPEIAKISGDYSYSPDCQFISSGVTFNVEMLQPESAQQMEDFFDKLWYNLGCDYYEKY